MALPRNRSSRQQTGIDPCRQLPLIRSHSLVIHSLFPSRSQELGGDAVTGPVTCPGSEGSEPGLPGRQPFLENRATPRKRGPSIVAPDAAIGPSPRSPDTSPCAPRHPCLRSCPVVPSSA